MGNTLDFMRSCKAGREGSRPFFGQSAQGDSQAFLERIEAMSMIRKGQVPGISQGDGVSQVKLIEKLFGVA